MKPYTQAVHEAAYAELQGRHSIEIHYQMYMSANEQAAISEKDFVKLVEERISLLESI